MTRAAGRLGSSEASRGAPAASAQGRPVAAIAALANDPRRNSRRVAEPGEWEPGSRGFIERPIGSSQTDGVDGPVDQTIEEYEPCR